jgi:hypothetical protein
MPPDAYARHVRRFHEAGIQVNGSFVFGFDHDRPSVFADTVRWIEDNRLACATFHILTPYPGTPLFRQLEQEGRLLTREWALYDTGHAVFRPKHMSPAQLEEGYAWAYRRLFSHASIWRRRPDGAVDAAAYLGMAYLYKRANPLWTWLIRHERTRAVWRPLVLASWAKGRLRARRGMTGKDEAPRAVTLHADGTEIARAIEAPPVAVASRPLVDLDLTRRLSFARHNKGSSTCAVHLCSSLLPG